jgi:diaminopimelate epimerase
VQAAHAAISSCQRGIIGNISHPILVVATVENEDELLRASVSLTNVGVPHSVFFEDDVKAYTALASGCLSGETRKLFRRYPLLK